MIVDNYTDVDTFAEYIMDLYQNEAKRALLAKNGRITIEEIYSPEAQFEIVKKIMNRIYA